MNKILPLVNIGSKSGQFKYILAQMGKKYLVRGDPAVDYHGRSRSWFSSWFIVRSCREDLQEASRWSRWSVEWSVHIGWWEDASWFRQEEDQSVRSIRSKSVLNEVTLTLCSLLKRLTVRLIIKSPKQFFKRSILILPLHSVHPTPVPSTNQTKKNSISTFLYWSSLMFALFWFR